MLKKTLFVLSKQCGKGWRFDESQCFFNVKAVISCFLGLNIWALAILINGKSNAFAFFGISDSNALWPKFIFPVLIFLTITIVYPKRKVFALDETTINAKAVKISYLAFAIFTILFLTFAGLFGRP